MKTLKERYQKEIIPGLMKEFKFKNINQVPKLTKIVINRGVGEVTQNAKAMEIATAELTLIAGQKAAITKAKKSIATFKIRAGMPIGCKVTIRGDRMFSFMDKLVNISLPKIRDFRGVNPKSFDGNGNYSMGITEQLIFPEVDYDKIDKIRGMDITICTSAQNDKEARSLLEAIGIPFRKGQ